jgi:hypothetical protein
MTVFPIVDAAHMTRADGWRYDLAFLGRWAKAKTYHPFRTETGDRPVHARSPPRSTRPPLSSAT